MLATLLPLALAAAEAASPAAPLAAPPADAAPSALGAGPVAAAAALAALAVAALLLGRRRRAAPRRVEVLETTSLGPKRALVVARVGRELVLLASSEAGIAVLPARLDALPEAEPAPVGPVASALRRLVPGRASAPGAPAFDALLAESAEDQELRAKLARGLAGSVP